MIHGAIGYMGLLHVLKATKPTRGCLLELQPVAATQTATWGTDRLLRAGTHSIDLVVAIFQH